MAHTEIGVGVSFKGHVAITSNKSEGPVWLLASGMGFWGRGSLFSHELRFKAHPAQRPAPRARNREMKGLSFRRSGSRLVNCGG